MRVTIEDVAARAGVSVATVSRALRGLPNVAASTRERVETVARELDYRADPHAAALAAGRSRTIGMAVPLLTTWYFTQVVSGVEAVLSEAGYDLLLVNVGDPDSRQRLVDQRSLFSTRVDGLILVDLNLPEDEARRLADAGARVVTVGHRTETFPSVTIQDEAAAGMATRHLLNLDHGAVALIGGDEATGLVFPVPARRRRGFLRAHDEIGRSVRPELMVGASFSIDGGTEAMANLLSLPDPPTAVFAMSDEIALGALKMARDLGLRVPEDLSIIGFDDHEVAEVVGLTTIRQPVVDHGAAAARLMLGQIEDETTEPHHVEHSTRLVVRNTTRRRAGAETVLAS